MSEPLRYTDDLAAIKKKLLDQSFLEGVASGDVARKGDHKIAEGIADIPVKRMIDQALFLKENILPRIKSKAGDKAPDYIFFSGVYDSLLWAIVMADRYEYLEGRYVRLKCFEVLTRENMARMEAELQKYMTLEEFFLSTGLDKIAKGVKDRAEELLKQNKK